MLKTDKTAVSIKKMEEDEIEFVANIHKLCFARQKKSLEWVRSNFNAYPRILIYVAKNEINQTVGYIQWLQKSGFRQGVVLELEQIAVLPECQGKKIGSELILQSLTAIKITLGKEDRAVKSIMVSTRFDNHAQKLYAKVLGAKVVATVQNLYSADEVIMLANEV